MSSLFKEWLNVCSVSKKAGLGNLLSLPYGYTRFKNPFTYKGVLFEDNAVKNFIRKNYPQIIDKYRKIDKSQHSSAEKIVWMFWWQGLENASTLIKGCIESARNAFQDYQVIVITEENYREYLDLPDYIIEKHSRGYITTTELADISRCTLLSKYGGIWSDISLLFCPPVLDFTNYEIFSLKHYEDRKCYLPSKERWSSYFLYSSVKEHPFFAFARDIFFEYWKNEKALIDYFFIDYIWWVAYEELPDIRKAIDAIPVTCKDVYLLQRSLNKPFNKDYYDKLVSTTWAFKLRRHDEYQTEINGEQTFYGYLFCRKTL